MKKKLAGFLLLMFLGVLSWAQGTRNDLFDVKKLQQELEIMKGILSTTLSFVTRETPKPGSTAPEVFALAQTGTGRFWIGSSRINAFYLYGQGAIFVVPASSLRLPQQSGDLHLNSTGYALAFDSYLRDASAMALDAEHYSRAVAEAAEATAAAASAGTQNPVPKAATPSATPQVNQEALRQAQEKVKKSQEDQEARRAKNSAALAQVKGFLIEALANYGDSMTTVKPNEYVTLVLVTDDFDLGLLESGARPRNEIISVQKSWITDYKAGRMTLEAFKQKALQYTE